MNLEGFTSTPVATYEVFMKLKEFYRDESSYSPEESYCELRGKPCSPTYRYPVSKACFAAAIINLYPRTFEYIFDRVIEETGMIPPRVNKLGYEVVKDLCDRLDI